MHHIKIKKRYPQHIEKKTRMDNQSKTQTKKGNGKMNKDTGKWCKFHKIPWHNTNECPSNQKLVAELKSLESYPGFDFDSEPEKGKGINDAEPSATVATTKFQPNEPEEMKEGDHLFHLQM
jgi:hypothetical protein